MSRPEALVLGRADSTTHLQWSGLEYRKSHPTPAPFLAASSNLEICPRVVISGKLALLLTSCSTWESTHPSLLALLLE